jgi:ribosome-binding protein aMBF1 (putative translation factor)
MITYMKSEEYVDFETSMASRELNWDEGTKTQWAQIQIALLGKRFKEVLAFTVSTKRTELGLSQRELSDRTGINQRDICHIEQGKANPTLTTQVKLLAALGLKLEITSK